VVLNGSFLGVRVSELEESIGMKAPPRGASGWQIAAFIRGIQRWDRGTNGEMPLLVMEIGEAALDFAEHVISGMLVCYTRAQGTRHCVLKEGRNTWTISFQIRDIMCRVKLRIKAPGTMVDLVWTLRRSVHAGRSSPVPPCVVIRDSKTGAKWVFLE
jgi:hypothetical protein